MLPSYDSQNRLQISSDDGFDPRSGGLDFRKFPARGTLQEAASHEVGIFEFSQKKYIDRHAGHCHTEGLTGSAIIRGGAKGRVYS